MCAGAPRWRRWSGPGEAFELVGEIVLVRHGETEWSLAGRHTSNTDLPLTEAGRRQASGLGASFSEWSFGLVLCSPLRRARETCELAGLGERAEILDDLREWDYGDYEGLTTPQIRAQRPDWSLWRDGCPGGETPAQVGARADRVLARLRAADGGDAVAFAHGHILRVTGARWIDQPAAGGAHLLLSAGALSVLGHERETEAISRWNQAAT
jgi:broad specificity phosphatase PhoE